MIKKIVSFALHQPMFFVLMTIIFIGGGIACFIKLPIEAFPDVSDIQVNVVTLYPGRAPEEVEKQVTIPIETALAGVPHCVRIFSHTQFGLSYMMLTFDDNVNDYFARSQVMERLQTADLPEGVQPQMAPLSTAIGEIYRYRLKCDGLDSRELRTLQDWVVERQFKTVSGVADVTTMGGLVKQYEVNPDMGKMRFYNVTLQQLFTALGRGNANAGGSYVDQGAQQYLIRGIGMLRSADDIRDIVITARNGTPIFVKDIAEVTIGAVPRQGVLGQDDDDDIVNGIILMRKGENPSYVLDGIKERIQQLNERILPKGVKIVPYYDRAWLIHTTLDTVFHNLAHGAMLVALVLLLFLGNVRAAFIVALMIPLSLLATFIGLTWRGIPANLLSLGAMDFGIIVDGAVIVVENILHRLAEQRTLQDRHALRHTILEAAAEVGRPTFFSMLIIIAAHLPIFTLQRHEGRIFSPMAWTVTSALIGSLIFSLTLVPLLCYFMIGKKIPHGDNWLVRGCKRVYRPSLTWALQHRKTIVFLAVLTLGISFALAPRLGTEFLPELNEGTTWVNVNLPAGVSVDEAQRQCAKYRAAMRSVPEVATVVSKAGRPEDGTDPKPINMLEFFVGFKPEAQWRKGYNNDKIVSEMDQAIAALPGNEKSFDQPIRDNVLESISQIDGQIVVKIFGEDTTILREQVEKVLASIRQVTGVERAFIDRAGDVPQSIIEIDRKRAARYGLNIQDIQDVIETALGGKAATQLWEGEKHFSVVTRLPEARRKLSNIKDILLDTPDGQHIPLQEVADFKTVNSAMNIARENGTRVTAVGVFIKGRDMGSVVKDMQERVNKIAMPPGYTVTWSGEFENQQRAMRRLAVIVPVSVFIIFVLLFNAFGTVKSALLILLNVPFALVGGIFALLLTHIPVSVSAAIGFIALFGQAVLNGVVMVSYFNQRRAAGDSPLETVLEGSLVRMRTVLMTALLAMLGLLPMALSHGIGSETQKPLAIVIIGGLISATALTLIVLPTLYLIFIGRGEPDADEEDTPSVPDETHISI